MSGQGDATSAMGSRARAYAIAAAAAVVVVKSNLLLQFGVALVMKLVDGADLGRHVEHADRLLRARGRGEG